ncbi:hypothetical protein A1Q1_03190 [Trichosporon asahii var. asahii CBS 2479]|uniref:NmrA-like domain-containing protein n=1 Tax=Trichosporon asahii var. asahii (strain ATCC 90039 / CBS 2479 / JCM 2466 / KCTC 7840 / NBRC 103889/ NCYC 2677 / UAMH 7654) TaxID=1186058 RepID=J4UAY0_TRIAS|nr:hypothetical protein A1Q1_03190 [Trichosporon asahii var. asahii CBS 2479]EJT47955.1 hypothetical protein A1Q1_03190 [Trichosporon asahii var. asahii CBS 2479]
MPRKIFVFGGSSVARALTEQPDKWEVYGLTRNPDSDAAKAIAALGVKLVKGDLDDPKSYAEGLKGSYGAFIVANFWLSYTPNGDGNAAAEIEYVHTIGAVDACVAAGVKHVIYSTLESFKPRVAIPHYDGKARVTAYMREHGVPSTQLFTSYFFENLLSTPWKEEGGRKILQIPMTDDTPFPGFSAAETGLWVRAAFEDESWIGKDMDTSTEDLTPGKIAQALAEVSGQKWETQHLSDETFLALEQQIDYEWWINFYALFKGEMKRDTPASRKIAPSAMDLKQWLQTPEAKAYFKY